MVNKNKNAFINKKNNDIFIKIILSLVLLFQITKIKDIKKFQIEFIDKFGKNKKYYNKNKFFFFEKNQDDLDYCENYGIMIYDYYWNRQIKNFPNIGDYIQSLAALQFLPKNCKPYFVDRDLVRFYQGPKVKLIMNSWNKIHEGNKYTSIDISPLYISYHINNKGILPSIFIKNLKKYEPIGCRDFKTKNQLNKYGVKVFFSGCLTLTLGMDYSANKNERTNEIIFIDYQIGSYIKADEFLNSLKAYNFNDIIHTKHEFNLKLTHIERFQLAKKLLDKYARAKLVISTRIHGALPCLGLNTPVIFINKEYDHNRYPGIYELMNTIGINSNGKFEIRVNIDNKGLIYNSKKYLEYSNRFKKKLQNFHHNLNI